MEEKNTHRGVYEYIDTKTAHYKWIIYHFVILLLMCLMILFSTLQIKCLALRKTVMLSISNCVMCYMKQKALPLFLALLPFSWKTAEMR